LCWVSLLSEVLWQWLAVFSVPQLLKTQTFLLTEVGISSLKFSGI